MTFEYFRMILIYRPRVLSCVIKILFLQDWMKINKN